jgi:hypothetical protein
MELDLRAAVIPTVTAPTNLVASNITSNGFKLAWTASTLITGTGKIEYIVEAKQDVLYAIPTSTVSGTTATVVCSFSGRYSVYIKARVNAVGGTVARSEFIYVDVPALKPTAPVLAVPSVSDIKPLEVTLKWSGSTSNGPVYYDINLNGNSVRLINQYDRTVTIPITPDSTYTCQVFGFLSVNTIRTGSNIITFRSPAVFKPRAPVLAGPSGTNLGIYGATLSWVGSTSNAPLSYSLIVDGVTGDAGLTETSRFVSLLPPGSTHTCQVVAVAYDKVTPSNTVNVRTIPIFQPRAPVLAGPTGSNLGIYGATFSWSGSTSNVPLSYSLIVDSVTGPTGLTGTSRFVSLLPPGSSHTCQVLAIADDKVTPSNIVNLVTIPIIKPIAPVLAGPSGTNLGLYGATLTWSKSTSNVPLSYSLIVDSVTGPTGLTGTSRFVSLLPPGSKHTCQVLAIADDKSTFSNTVNVRTTPIIKPLAPLLLGSSGTNLGLYGSTLAWRRSLSNVPLSYSLIVDSVTGPTGLTGTSKYVPLSFGSTHACQVVAFAADKSTFSNTVNVNIPVGKPTASLLAEPTQSNIDPFGATLSWTASTSNVPVTYSILVDSVTGPTEVSETSKYVPLSFGSTHTCQVLSVAGDKSTPSNIVNAKVPLAKPTASVVFEPTKYDSDHRGATFTWTPSISNVPVSYAVFVDNSIKNVDVKTTSQYVYLSYGVPHTFKILAVTDVNKSISTYSNTIDILIPANKLSRPGISNITTDPSTITTDIRVLIEPAYRTSGAPNSNYTSDYRVLINNVDMSADGTFAFNYFNIPKSKLDEYTTYEYVVRCSENDYFADSLPYTYTISAQVPSAFVLDEPSGTNLGYLGATLTWSASTSNVPVTYNVSINNSTVATGVTGTSYYAPLSFGGPYKCFIRALARDKITISNLVNVVIPARTPTAPVLTIRDSDITSLGATLTWTESTSNIPLTYSIVVDDVTSSTGLTGTSRFVSMPVSTHVCKVLAIADTVITPSNTVTVNIPVGKPTKPAINTPTYGLTNINLSWSASTSNVPVKYKITYGTQVITDLDATTYSINNLIVLRDYSFVVTAVAGTETTDSDSVTARIPIANPTKPIVTYTSNSDSIGLSWSASITNVPVKYSVRSNGNLLASELTRRTYTISGFVGGTNTIVVTAFAGTLSTESETLIVTVPIALPTKPVITFTYDSYNINLSWSASTSNIPVKYNITANSKSVATNLTTTTYTVKSIGGFNLPIVVTAIADTLMTDSDILYVFVDAVQPTKPVIYTPTIGPNSITLTWSPSTSNGPVTYRIRLETYLVLSNFEGTTFTLTPLGANLDYSIVVIAVTGTATTESDVLRAKIQIIKPTKPVVTSGIDVNTIYLAWTPSTSNTPVRYKITSNGTQLVTDYNNTVYNINSFDYNVPYTFVVTALTATLTTESDPITTSIRVDQPTKPEIDTPTYGSNSINLSWSPSISNLPVQYKITYGTQVITGITATSYTITIASSMSGNLAYSIVVTGIVGRLSTDSDAITATIPITKPTKAVINEPTYGPDPNTINLSWSASISNVPVKYNITSTYIEGNIAYSFSSATDLTTTSYSVGQNLVDRNYSFVVSAIAGTLTTDSDARNARIPINPPTKPVITAVYPPVTETNPIPRSAVLSWNVCTSFGATVSYTVICNGTQLVDGLNATTYTIGNLTGGFGNTVYVVSKALGAYGGTSETYSDATTVTVPIMQPTSFAVRYVGPIVYGEGDYATVKYYALAWTSPVSNSPLTYTFSIDGGPYIAANDYYFERAGRNPPPNYKEFLRSQYGRLSSAQMKATTSNGLFVESPLLTVSVYQFFEQPFTL